MSVTPPLPRLLLLPRADYVAGDRDDPLRFYFAPLVGRFYRRRLELCLAECRGGERVLEVGFGSGVSLRNLAALYREVHGLDLHPRRDEVAAVFSRHGLAPRLLTGDVRALPYPDAFFDTVLAVSILEHLRPADLRLACAEIARVLKPGGQAIYGVPVERDLMVWAFAALGCDIRRHHFSTERDVERAADAVLDEVRMVAMRAPVVGGLLGAIYEVGHFRRRGVPA